MDFYDRQRQKLGLEPIIAPIFERAEARNRIIPSTTPPASNPSTVIPAVKSGLSEFQNPVIRSAALGAFTPRYTPVNATPPISAEQSQKGAELLRESIKEKLSDGSPESEQYLASVNKVYGSKDDSHYAFVKDNAPLKREIAQEINQERAENTTKVTQDSLWAGLTSLNSSLIGPLKAVTDTIGWKEGSDFFQDYYIDVNNEAQEQVQENIDKGLTNEYLDAFTQGTVGAIPSAAMGYLSGGSSLAAQAATATTGTAATGLSTQVLNASKQLLSNPNFHFSMIQSFGGSYNQAKESGASTDQAILSAIYSSVPQSIIEISGGTEKLMSKIASKIGNRPSRDIVQSALEEALEEVAQYPFEGIAQKVTYNPDIPVFSTTENAIINPVDMIKNAAIGGSVGALLGGGGELINSAVNSRPVRLPDGSTVYVDQNNNPVSLPQNTSLENAEAISQINQNAPVNGTEAGSNAIAPIRVGRNTVIQSPYNGQTPVYVRPANNTVPVVPEGSLSTAANQIASAKIQQSQFGKSFRNYLKSFYNSVFEKTGGVREVTINGLDFDGQPYVVTVNKNTIGKVVSDPNVTAEKLALFDVLNDVIQNGEYVGSGTYTPHGSKTKNVTRYDYFETPVQIGGKDYLVSFDVEVIPGHNNYRTHKVINKIDLTSTADGEAGPVPAASATGGEAGPVPTAPVLGSGLKGAGQALNTVKNRPQQTSENVNASALKAYQAPNTDNRLQLNVQNEPELASTPIIPGFSPKINQNASSKSVARTRESDGKAVTWHETEKDTVSNASRAFEEKYGIETKLAKPSKKTEVSAFLQDGKIVLNADAINTYSGTVGKIAHEATHIIQGTDAWEGAKEAALAYYKAIDPNITMKDLKQWKTEEYRGLTDLNSTQQVQEVVAGFLEDICSRNDLVGEQAARILVQENPKGFRRITQYFKDKVQSLKAYLPAGTGLNRQQRLELQAAQRGLKNLKKGLEAYQKGKVQTAQGTQYSIGYTTQNNPVVTIDNDVLDQVPKSDWVRKVKEVIGTFSEGIPVKGRLIKVNKITRNEFTNSKNSKDYRRYNREVYRDKFQSSGNLDEILLASTNYINEDLKHERKDNFKEFARGNVLIQVGTHKYSAKVIIGFTTGNQMVLYDIVDFRPTQFTIKNENAHTTQPINMESSRNGAFSNTNIPQKANGVNNSISKTSKNDTPYSYGDKPFSQAVDEIAAHKQGKAYETSHVYMGKTPKVLTDLGLNQLPMLITSKHIDTIMNASGSDPKANYHGLGKELVKQIPEALENPVMVMMSNTKPDQSIVVLTTLKDSRDNPVISAIRFNGRGNYNNIEISANVVTSTYGKNSINKFIDRAVHENRVLYFNKQKSQQLKQTPGVQFPDNLSTTDFSSNIARLKEFVKREGTNNSISKTSKNDTPYSYGDSSVASLMEFMNRKYGTIPEGENAYRKVTVPRRTSEGTKTRQGIRTILEAKSTPDQMAEALKQQVVEDAYAYVPVSDKNAEMQAEKTIRDRGQKGALERWNAVVNGTELANKETLALAEKLMVEAGKQGDVELFQKLAAEISAEATRAGQTVQAMRLIKKMTPEGQLYYLQKSLDSVQKDLKRRFKNKAPELEISEELAKALLDAKSQEEIDAAEQKIFVEIANQIPSTWMDKWDSWRYLAMLANPRTHIRNVLGNTVFVPARLLKNAVSMGIEHLRVGNHRLVKPENRTAAVLTKSDKQLLEFAEKDFESVKESLTSSGKMNPSNRINELRRIYKTRWLETLRKANNQALDAEDMFFLKRAYTHSMARIIKARKLDLDFLTSGSREANIQRQKIQALATQEALEATYRDASAMANALNRFKNSNPAANVFGNALFAFTKTPINVLKRGVEYSPAGLIKGVVDGISMVRSGKKTATDVVSDFSKSLSGVGISLFGYWLASMGLLSAGAPEDDKEKGFETLQGAKNYALKIGDTYYTIDWMAPVALPLFVGAELHNALEGKGFDLAAVADSLTKVSEPMFNLSMLDGINSAFKSIAYSEGNYLTDFATEAALDYISQALPTLGSQIARTIDPTVRNGYYIDKTSVIPEGVQTLLNTIQSKIPGFSYLLAPKVDQWGRTTNKENVVLRAFENFISPGYISTRKETLVDKELAEIYEETGEKSVLPSYADKSFKVDGETYRLSSKEYTEYAQAKGQLSFKLINELLSNSDYQKLDVDEKVEIIGQMYQAANAEAKKEVNSDYDIPNTVIKAYEANKQAGILYGEYYLWKMSLDSTPNMQEVIDALNRTNLTKSQKKFLFAQRFPQSNNNPFS